MTHISETSLLDELRESRKSNTVAFNQFVENYKFHLSHVFCFYEGEDGKYYNQRIKNYTSNNIIPICVGNKEKTIKVWRKISDDPNYSNVSKMFFVDRDMDDPPSEINEDLYITPCYSIENLYVNSETLGNILESEFLINSTHPDYSKCVEVFERLYAEFCDHMVDFNSLVLLRKKKGMGNGKVSLEKFKMNKVIEITLDNVRKKDEYDNLWNQLKSDLDAEDQEITEAIKEIETNGNFPDVFRGKNQLHFLIKIINLLKEKKVGDFFTEKHPEPKINVDFNTLSSLSQYAVTPKCLIDFIICHKIGSV